MKYLFSSLLAILFWGSCKENVSRDSNCDRAYISYFQNHTVMLEKVYGNRNDLLKNSKIDTSKIYIQRMENTGFLGVTRKINSVKFEDINYPSFIVKREDCLVGDMNYKEIISYPNGDKDTLNIVYLQGSNPSLAAKCIVRCSENSKFGAGIDIIKNGKSVFKNPEYTSLSTEYKLIKL